MFTNLTGANKAISYLEAYYKEIAPRLRNIDIMLKESEGCISLEQAAHALDISENEVEEIMEADGLKVLTKNTFFNVMKKGSSEICELFRRETELNSPYVYTKENISYIYQIELDKINTACENLKINKITDYTLPILFSNIVL